MTVAVSNESATTVADADLARVAQFVMNAMGVDADVELAVTLVDEERMTQLHEKYMGEPGPTDVLAFPMDDLDSPHPEEQDVPLLGDVIVCPTIAARQAHDAGHGIEDELRVLCAHGVLHLLGYDHHEPDEEREMFALQARLLAEFTGVADP